MPKPTIPDDSQRSVTVLSERDRNLLLELLDNPPGPSPGLQEMLSNYERVARFEDKRTVLNFATRASSTSS